MPVVDVIPAADPDQVAGLLARAFAEDPVIRFMVPDPARDIDFWRAIARYENPDAVLDVAVSDGEPVGAAIWHRPGAVSVDDPAAEAIFAEVFGDNVDGATELDRLCHQARPEQPHWYLADLGAAVRGKGAGGALLRAGLERAEGPVYLESSNVVNLPIYERFGFAVTGEIVVPGGPTLWGMLRPE